MKSIIVETSINNPMTYLMIIAIKYQVFSEKFIIDLKLDFNILDEKRNSDFIFTNPGEKVEGFKLVKPCFFQRINIDTCDYVYEKPNDFLIFEHKEDRFEQVIDNFFQEIEFKSIRGDATSVLATKKNTSSNIVNDFIRGMNKTILIIQRLTYEEKKKILIEQLLVDDKILDTYLQIYYDLI